MNRVMREKLAADLLSLVYPGCGLGVVQIELMQKVAAVLRQPDEYEEIRELIKDIKEDRYGAPLIAALHLCLELTYTTQSTKRMTDNGQPVQKSGET